MKKDESLNLEQLYELDKVCYEESKKTLLAKIDDEQLLEEIKCIDLPSDGRLYLSDILMQYYNMQVAHLISTSLEEKKINTIDIVEKKISVISRCIEIANERKYSNEEAVIRISESINAYPMDTIWFYEITEMIDAEYLILRVIKNLSLNREISKDVVIRVIINMLDNLCELLEKEKCYYHNEFL